MTKRSVLKNFFLLFFILILSYPALAIETVGQNAWQIDKFMRFQIAYMPDKIQSTTWKNDLIKAQAVLEPSFAPDITNINLANFLSLGFDVPKSNNPEAYNFYLKLYEFPEVISCAKITTKFFSDFALNKMQNFSALHNYIADKNNIVIKLGYIARRNMLFTADNPIPPLQVAKGMAFTNYFVNHIPFYSLYLTPVKTSSAVLSKDAVTSSMSGVANFYQDLLATYRANFDEVSGVDPNYFYFVSRKIDPRNYQITILKVPKQILIFANWRDLPMPQNPKNIFLTSLLLVYKTDYKLKSDGNTRLLDNLPAINSNEFKTIFVDPKTQILEVGSVIYTSQF